MCNAKLCLSFLYLFYSIFCAAAATAAASFNSSRKCPADQSLALLLFKQNLLSVNDTSNALICQYWLGSAGFYPIMMNWKPSTDCCNWDGVTCNPFTGDVIDLDLSCGMLRGTIHPNTTLFHLPHLQRLNLAYNNFTDSQLPHEVGRSSNSLTHLNISSCGLSGQLPSEITLLSKLVSLDLSWNGFGLQMQPYVLSNLLSNSTHLTEVLLSGVNISWVLPTYLDISSTSLRSLSSVHWFEAKLPLDIFNLPYLVNLDLSFNEGIIGPLPKVNTSTNIPLKSLDLSYSNLSGEIFDSVGHLKSLNYLNLSNNTLLGEIPDSIGHLTSLSILLLSSCSLVGPLPKSLANLTQLVTGFIWKAAMLGCGCGTLLGLVMGYLMLSTRRPKWFNGIADAGDHMIQTKINKNNMKNKRRHVYIGK